MTQYACVACCEPAPAGAYDCTCGGAIAEVLEPAVLTGAACALRACDACLEPGCQCECHEKPPGITRDQYVQICRHFTYRGVIHRATRMRRLSELTGRAIHDYWDLTEAEAARAVTDLGRWAHGVRRQEP